MPVPQELNYDPRSANPFHHFIHGFRFFFSGLPLLFKHPTLLGLSLLPITFTLVILFGVAWGAVWLAGSLVEPGLSPITDQFRLLGQALVFLIVLLLGYLLYLPLARVVLAPFSEALSRRAETIFVGKATKAAFGWKRAMIEGAKLVGLQLIVTVIVLVFSVFVPVVGTPIGVVIAAFFCGLDYLDVPLSVRGLSLGKKLAVMWRNKSLALGFGAAGYLLLFIPLVNLLSLPVGVIGATRLVSELDESEN